MRHLIDIIEAQSTAAPNSGPVLVGTLDVPGLTSLLSKVTDAPTLQTAVTNLKAGAPLTLSQDQQLALAFISLLDANDQTRRAVMLKMQNVSLSAPAGQSEGQPVSEAAVPGSSTYWLSESGEMIAAVDHGDAVRRDPEAFGIPNAICDQMAETFDNSNGEIHSEHLPKEASHYLEFGLTGDDENDVWETLAMNRGWVRVGAQSRYHSCYISAASVGIAIHAARLLAKQGAIGDSLDIEITNNIGLRNVCLKAGDVKRFLRSSSEQAKRFFAPDAVTEDLEKQKSGWDVYTQIGHKKKSAIVWYMFPGGKIETYPYMKKSDNHDMSTGGKESKAIAVGRIDPKSMKISVRTPLAPGNSWVSLPESKLDYITRRLAKAFPDYEIWYFGNAARDIRRVV